MTQEICYNCEGRGHGDGDMMFFVCPRCNGSGVLESVQHSVQRIDYWFAFMSFLAGLGAGYLMCILSTINR